MFERVVFGIFAAMILGYLFVEFARYRRGREKSGDADHFAYPAIRLFLRVSTSVALVATVWIAVFLKPFYGGDRLSEILAMSASGVLVFLVTTDLTTTWRQYRSQRLRREQQFIIEIAELVDRSRNSTP